MKQNSTGKLIFLFLVVAILAMFILRIVTSSWMLSDDLPGTARVSKIVWVNFAIELVLLLAGLWLVSRFIVRDRRNTSRLDRTAHLTDIALMSGGLAHEARNHIHAMKAHFALIRKRADDPDKVLDRVSKLESVADDLESLLTDFLTFARPSRDDLSELNLIELINELVELQRPALELQNIKLQFDDPKDLPVLYLDRQKIRSALINLIRNAAEAIERDGMIRLRLRRAQRRILLDIEDDGCGIPPDEQPKVFQSFFTTKTGGTGLGLAIVERTIQDMGGRISVRSQVEKGTTFTIELPVNSPEQIRSRESDREEHLCTSGQTAPNDDRLPLENSAG